MSLIISENHKSPRVFAIVLVLLSGIVFSSSGLVYRLIELATPWQVLFYRSFSLCLMLALWLGFQYRRALSQLFLKIGLPAVIGGACLSIAFTGFILAIEHTSIANAMLILAVSPFSAALLGRLILNERVSGYIWICMVVAALGVGIMAGEELSFGRGLGEFFALTSALGFSGLTVSLRIHPQLDMLPTIFIASCIATLLASLGILIDDTGFRLITFDLILSSGMGVFQIGLGFFLFTAGARHLQAVELTLLSMTEIIAGPILVWVGLGEEPTFSAFIGGGLILGAITAMALLGAKRENTIVKNLRL